MKLGINRQVRLAAGAGAVSLVAVMGGASSASAATCKINGITPSVVSVGLADVTRTWSVQTAGCASPVVWGLAIPVSNWEILEMGITTPTGTISSDLLENANAGLREAYVAVAQDKDAEVVVERTLPFTLKRAARWGAAVNAAPEPVKKGKIIKVSAALGRVNWDTRKFNGYSGQRVTLQFKAAGTTAFKNVKVVKTVKYGKVTASVTASQDGSWRFYYGGNSITGAATSNGDYVDVQ